MAYLPEFIKRLVEHFDKLPGIGPKTASKLVFYLLQDQAEVKSFAADLETASMQTLFCSECQDVSDRSLCSICSDQHRDQRQICVVASSQDLQTVEKTKIFLGRYHVLHGYINPIEGITPDKLKINELLTRIKRDKVKEVILALDPTLEGEATSMYLTKVIKPLSAKITKLGRGLPIGSNVEYADEITLTAALENRKDV